MTTAEQRSPGSITEAGERRVAAAMGFMKERFDELVQAIDERCTATERRLEEAQSNSGEAKIIQAMDRLTAAQERNADILGRLLGLLLEAVGQATGNGKAATDQSDKAAVDRSLEPEEARHDAAAYEG